MRIVLLFAALLVSFSVMPVTKALQLCDEDSNYWVTCPSDFTIDSATELSPTTAQTIATVVDEGGTAYICGSTASSKTFTDIEAGTGCDYSTSTSWSTSGEKTIKLSGLTASTTYYTHISYVDNGRRLVQVSGSYTTSAPFPSSDAINTCSNLGTSDGTGYSCPGTTHNITTSNTMADVAALSLSSGDCVLFQAGGTYNVNNAAQKLDAVSGVTYGRYDVGANPKIVNLATDLTAPCFQGIVDITGNSNVVFDGIDVSNPTLQSTQNACSSGFGRGVAIWVNNSTNVTVSRLTVDNSVSGGIQFVNGSGHLQEYTVTTGVGSNPHESNTISGVDTMTYRYNKSGGSSHASFIIKGGASNIEAYENELYGANTDPNVYIETARNVTIRDNWIHGDGSQKDLALVVALENWVSAEELYNQNIEIFNNVIEDKARTGIRVVIQSIAGSSGPAAQPMMDDIHIHNNAIYDVSGDAQNWFPSIDAYDNRAQAYVDLDDWNNIVIEDNTMWATGATVDMDINDSGIDAKITARHNLFQTGVTGEQGTNAVVTGTVPFENLGGRIFAPAGPALGASSTGGDIGATTTWTCGQ